MNYLTGILRLHRSRNSGRSTGLVNECYRDFPTTKVPIRCAGQLRLAPVLPRLALPHITQAYSVSPELFVMQLLGVWSSLVALLLVITCWAASPALAPSIDFGWLRATQTNQGWLLTYVYESVPSGDALISGDVLISVDHQRLEGLSPLSAAHVIHGIGSAQTAIVYRGEATVRLNFISMDERVIPLPRRRLEWPTRTYTQDILAQLLTLPDADGVIRKLSFGGKWTLLHIWDSFCNIGVDALNEIANPEPPDLHIVGIEIGHHVQDVRSDMTSLGLTFFTLVAEDAKAFL